MKAFLNYIKDCTLDVDTQQKYLEKIIDNYQGKQLKTKLTQALDNIKLQKERPLLAEVNDHSFSPLPTPAGKKRKITQR